MYSSLPMKEVPRMAKWVAMDDIWVYAALFTVIAFVIPAVFEVLFYYVTGITTDELGQYIKEWRRNGD